MKAKQSSRWAASAALALCAGMLGSVLTLLLTNNVSLHRLVSGMSAEDSPPGQIASDISQELPVNLEPLDDTEFESLTTPLKSSAELQRAFDAAAAERSQLAGVLAQLTQKLDTIESDFINQQSRQSLSDDESDPTQGPTAAQRRSRSRTDRLVAAGMDITTAELIQTRQNEYELQRLNLFDLAEREGWRESDRFSEQLEALTEQRPDLRDELGDSGYDRYLFESGRNNRVRVDSVIGGSAAELAGLQIGDVVLDYADSRIFSTRELQNATRGGSRGETITISVERQGQPLLIQVPRGPLGVGLDAEQENPS